jgi:hypothetical protein
MLDVPFDALAAAGIARLVSVSLDFLLVVAEKNVGMQCHMHMAPDSTWFHAGLVEKNFRTTPIRVKRNVANPKQNLPLKQSCGCRKTAPPT